MSNIIELKENKGFKFKLEPNFIDERKIQQVMSVLAGGWDKLSELESEIAEAHNRHIEHNQRLHKDKFTSLYKRWLSLDLKFLEGTITTEETPELADLDKKFKDNKYYKKFLALAMEKAMLYNYATLECLCIQKPDDFEFKEQTETTLIKIWSEYNKEKKNMIRELQNSES